MTIQKLRHAVQRLSTYPSRCPPRNHPAGTTATPSLAQFARPPSFSQQAVAPSPPRSAHPPAATSRLHKSPWASTIPIPGANAQLLARSPRCSAVLHHVERRDKVCLAPLRTPQHLSAHHEVCIYHCVIVARCVACWCHSHSYICIRNGTNAPRGASFDAE